MVSTILLAVGLVAGWMVYSYISGLRRNVQIARKTGLPYVVYAVHPHSFPWQLTFWIWLPLIKLLPKAWWEKPMIVLQPDWAYNTNQEYFDWVGSETFILAGPDDITLFTENPDLVTQMCLRREAFPKDIARYGVLTMFGQNVVSTEGAIWRMHRKVTSSSFNEKNAAHTFVEAIGQTKGMLQYYFNGTTENKTSTKTIKSLEHDTMMWALNIIGHVGFGLRLIWPGQKVPDDPKLAKYGALDPPPGYTMTFAESLGGLLHRIITILLVPNVILKILPFHFAREAAAAKENYYRYMKEFLHDKVEQVRRGDREQEGMDIMGQLVRSTYEEKAAKSNTPKLTDDEIISNAFIMTLAGHETTANILHFTLIELANNPASQRRLQKDVDALFGDSDPSTWDYEKNVNPLLASQIGACINETMRMMPPVTAIPKIVSPTSDQAITYEGRRIVLPAGLSINMVAPAIHRNPRWWPTKPSERTGRPTDLDEWIPERWYRATAKSSNGSDAAEDGEDYGGFQGSDTSASLYRPVRGSFVPFSDGPRSCLGRRIAVVELIAALGVIFQKYSVELAVDEWATDEEVKGMSAEERRALYAKAREKSRATVGKASAIITLKFNGSGQYVPVRLVKRGSERFVGDQELV
ncbi:cytochrome P450 [Lasiosphaeria hispida]|uniref:Cytochrome P450 n=1 Tax=Lasiosphaeria hispida TaxID=260671 RepID=A0AAJ0HQ19_9PEZI|nr:cytochrome P450 [Lasiosphaeria hispida]